MTKSKATKAAIAKARRQIAELPATRPTMPLKPIRPIVRPDPDAMPVKGKCDHL
jgi:hypothetical protein